MTAVRRRRDHRSRVGKERRARTTSRILEVAVEVFADRGAEAPVIDDFVQAAGIARGTFYNHFKNVDELLLATSEATTRKVIEAVEDSIRHIEGPALRLGVGLRLFLVHARRQPLWSRFVARVWRVGGLELPMRDIDDGIRRGQFHVPGRDAAHDLMVGGVREAIRSLGETRVGASYCDDVVKLCLHALGADERRIAQAMEHPLPALPPLPGDSTDAEPRRGAGRAASARR